MAKYINREITWLKFNARVLQEARDPSVPLLERLRFLGIYSNNLDEFYRVRYATVLRALQLDSSAYHNIVENQPLEQLLKEIQDVIAIQQTTYDQTYNSIVSELEKENIYLLNENQLNESQAEFVKNYYNKKLSHAIPVYLWQVSDENPELKDGAVYLAIKITNSNTVYSPIQDSEKNSYALIEVPNHFSRFLVLPEKNGKKYVMLLEDVIRYNLTDIFSFLNYKAIEAHSIKITKDAELDLDEDIQESFMEQIEKSVEGRKSGEPVRLVYDRNMSLDMLNYLKSILHIHKYDDLSPGGKYHNKKDFINFPNMGRTDLIYKPIQPLVPNSLNNNKSYIQSVEEKDRLLYTPYQDYGMFLKFLREAAIDPRVQSIQITIYRVADDSQVMSALINAAKNGKQVTAVLELKARFDETNNVEWSKKLQDEGVHVIFGVPGLKVHSKLVLVTYKQDDVIKKIGVVSTGNFNEKTARIYTDYVYLTTDKTINQELDDLFKFFKANYKVKKYHQIIVSPTEMRKKIYKLIRKEVKNKKAGLPAQINLKLNSISDKGIIDELYKASNAGVEIRMVVRGICCLIPGIKGMSENIKAISVVDKFLEHPRVYWFKNAGDDVIYISSADMMTRNIDSRVEVAVPIKTAEHKQEIKDTFELSFTDNVKGRVQNATLDEIYVKNDWPENRSQLSIYEYYKKKYTL